MSEERHLSGSEIRASLDHPILDGDGHIVEYWPELSRYLEEEGVEGGMRGLMPTATFDGSPSWATSTPEQRAVARTFRGPWWGFPNDARDLATVTAPRLLHERLDELGIDLAVCFPSVGLLCPSLRDENLRRRGCRAYNRYAADLFEGVRDRLIPVASIPTHTPEEALEELDYCSSELGFKAVQLGGFVPRPFDDEPQSRGYWVDSLALDSIYDYDPLWQRLVELKIVPAFHSGSMGWGGRRSPTNFSYNHMGNFAAASEATAKSLFFGGVLHRFPELRVALLEGGVAWGVTLLNGLVEHWEKRGPEGLKDRDPSRLDGELYDKLVAEYGGGLEVAGGFGPMLPKILDTPDVVNDFEAAGISDVSDIVRQITTQCFFGCEADDASTGQAFEARRLPGRSTLSPIFSSDIGHWDVAHIAEVVPEAYEQVEKGWLDKQQFRAFMCDNALRMYTEMDPGFFEGTVLAEYSRHNREGA
jgi:predicted TIM-barrel fold metal-dependent hydrolase